MAAEDAENLSAANADPCTIAIDIEKNYDDHLNKVVAQVSATITKGNLEEPPAIVKPIILVNDEPPDGIDTYVQIGPKEIAGNSKNKALPTSRRFKRRFCRSKGHAVFKRSYSIA